jgi:uncharacterized protein YxjI
MYAPFQSNHFTIKKQVLALTGVFRVYDSNEQVIAYSRQKMFKLREDIRVYNDENQSQELLYIQARNIIDFSAAYEVYDSQEGILVGTLRRRGLRSILRDCWDVLAPGDNPIAELVEDSVNYALLRRLLLGRLLPQNYDVLMGEQKVMDLRQRFNLFRYELDLDFSGETLLRLDHRLGIAAGILLGVIEGKQESG